MNAPLKKLDVASLRAEFPILAREAYGKRLVYLDNAASAQKPRAVIDAMTKTLTQSYANVHRGLHLLSNEATAAYEEARGKVARFLIGRRRFVREKMQPAMHIGVALRQR
ncbi:MAG TPA: aminotransferase class V-fold PLP-dependent enzyme, partial [Parvularculaceae bacterium]|nr:aminotransferase class V-fold PLP-dependent enzyme [Parvularculaceae bacterium]